MCIYGLRNVILVSNVVYGFLFLLFYKEEFSLYGYLIVNNLDKLYICSYFDLKMFIFEFICSKV